MRFRKPFESCCHSKFCRKTRTLVKPSPSAQPNSRSIVTGSNESACHISSWLIAVLGMKLQPTSQRWFCCQALAFSSDQRDCALAFPQTRPNSSKPANGVFILMFIFLTGAKVFQVKWNNCRQFDFTRFAKQGRINEDRKSTRLNSSH